MRYESALVQQRQNELHANNANEYKRTELKTKLELERLMSEYYTHANFKLFQQELISCCIDCETQIVRDEFSHTVFQVSKSDKGARVGEVTYNTVNLVARCSCSRFESDGIPCRHMLVMLRSCHVNEMPSHYLLTRWAKKTGCESSGQWVGVPRIPKGSTMRNCGPYLQGV